MNDASNRSTKELDPPGGREWWLWPVDLLLVVFIGGVAAILIRASAAPFIGAPMLKTASGNIVLAGVLSIPGFIEPHALLFYTTGVGLLLLTGTCIWSNWHLTARSAEESLHR